MCDDANSPVEGRLPREMKVSAYVTLTHLNFRRHRCVQQHSPGILTLDMFKLLSS